MPSDKPPLPPAWPQHDARIIREYGGRWVVVEGREVIGAGADPAAACLDAACALHASPDQFVAVAIRRAGDVWT